MSRRGKRRCRRRCQAQAAQSQQDQGRGQADLGGELVAGHDDQQSHETDDEDLHGTGFYGPVPGRSGLVQQTPALTTRLWDAGPDTVAP